MKRDSGDHLDSLVLKDRRQRLADVFIHIRQQGRAALQHGDLRSDSSKELSELDGDQTAAQHQERGRRPANIQHLVAGQITRFVKTGYPHIGRARSGSNDKRPTANPHLSGTNHVGREELGA